MLENTTQKIEISICFPLFLARCSAFGIPDSCTTSIILLVVKVFLPCVLFHREILQFLCFTFLCIVYYLFSSAKFLN